MPNTKLEPPVSIGKAADYLGVHPNTIRRYESLGLITPESRTVGGHKRYAVADLRRLKGEMAAAA